jgi:hypothetical protein
LDKTESGNEIKIYSKEKAMQSLTESLHSVGELPVRLKRRDKMNYIATKVA